MAAKALVFSLRSIWCHGNHVNAHARDASIIIIFNSQAHIFRYTSTINTKWETFRFVLPTWNLFTQENEHRPWSQLSAGQVFSKVQVLAKSRNWITVSLFKFHYSAWFLHIYTFPSMLRPLSSISKNVTSLVIQKLQWALNSSGNLSCFFIFYCISTTFSHWTQIVCLNEQ